MSKEVVNYLQLEYDKQRELGKAEGLDAGNANSIRNLMKNLKMTAEQAMEALDIPKSEFKKYMTML